VDGLRPAIRCLRPSARRGQDRIPVTLNRQLGAVAGLVPASSSLLSSNRALLRNICLVGAALVAALPRQIPIGRCSTRAPTRGAPTSFCFQGATLVVALCRQGRVRFIHRGRPKSRYETLKQDVDVRDRRGHDDSDSGSILSGRAVDTVTLR
jgi:hypothetical protein